MLVVSAVHVAVGWVWHTAYRIRWHWRLKREGALMAAAAVVAFGAVDSARSMMSGHSAPQAVVASTAETVTATATPVLTEPKVVAVTPASTPVAAEPVMPISPIQTVAAVASPDLDNVAPEDRLPPGPDDPIAAKIKERLGDPVSTASIPDETPIKPKAVKPVRTSPPKPAPKLADKGDAPSDGADEPAKVKHVKSARAPATKPVAAATPPEKPAVAKAPIKKIVPKKPKSNETEAQ